MVRPATVVSHRRQPAGGHRPGCHVASGPPLVMHLSSILVPRIRQDGLVTLRGELARPLSREPQGAWLARRAARRPFSVCYAAMGSTVAAHVDGGRNRNDAHKSWGMKVRAALELFEQLEIEYIPSSPAPRSAVYVRRQRRQPADPEARHGARHHRAAHDRRELRQ